MERKKAESSGVPEWIVTYSDVMGLLLCFFVVLQSFSSIQESKFKQAMSSIQNYLGLLISSNYSILKETNVRKQSQTSTQAVQAGKKEDGDQDKKYKESYLISISENMKKESEKKGLGGSVEVIKMLNSLRIRIPSSVCFDQGDMKLSDKSKEFFQKIAGLVKEAPFEINIEGHTDDTPIYSETYESNWELSFARAMMVLRYLNKIGVPNCKLSAIAYGDTKPVVENNSVENKKKNRRVEILITAESDSLQIDPKSK